VVDEAQDTNIWLLILLHLLRKEGTRVTLVGDPDQCIYEFSMADASSLSKLKTTWKIPEMPLNQSFRCNNNIAEAVKNISNNLAFVGCGPTVNESHRAFVLREETSQFSKCITAFGRLLEQASIERSRSAILCRAHGQLESIRGEVNYTDLKGLTKEMAQAAFHRDVRKDYKRANQIVENNLREMTNEPGFWEVLDDAPDSDTAHRIRLALWTFTKSSEGLPSVSENGADWIEKLKRNITTLLMTLGISNLPTMGHKIKKTGFSTQQLILPLFEAQTLFPAIRQETIHQVKGESIDAVLMLGSAKFFNAVVKAVELNEDSEDRRLAYVAMTRARHTLLIGLPASHYDKHVSSWQKWGFNILSS